MTLLSSPKAFPNASQVKPATRGKPYVNYLMSMLRYLIWSHLHTHTNVTFLATDAHTTVLANLRDLRCSQPPKVWMQAGLRCCKRCS